MKIEVRHIDNTCLKEVGFIKVVKKYGRIKKDVLIVFDKRIKYLGLHGFDAKSKKHIIRLSPILSKIDERGNIISNSAEKYNLLSTILHELRHCQQLEELRSKYWDENYGANERIKEKDISVEFSEAESDARMYENKYILEAVKLYDEFSEESS